MAARAQPEKGVEDAMKNLKLDPPSKASTTFVTGPKDRSPSDAMSCISSVDASSTVKESEVDQEANVADQSTYYYGYYYPGFDGSVGEWDDHYYIVGADGLEIQHPAIPVENGSVVYHVPGFQTNYVPYGTFAPGAIIGVDGQYIGQQPYYSSPMFQQPLVSPGYFPQSVAYGPELVPAYQWDSTPLFLDGFQVNTFADPASSAPKPNFSSQSHKVSPSKTLSSLKSTTLEKKGSAPALDMSSTSVVNSPSLKAVNEAASALSKGYLPTNKFPLYSNQGKGGLFYQNTINIKDNGCTWVGPDKLKARNKVHEVGNTNLLNEQNCGPRTNGNKKILNSGVDQVESLGAEGKDSITPLVATIKKDQYNLPDFPTKYDHALFFVIKSYSEDDIHKSIKYNVWASTPNGNKRLGNAFQVAQEKMAETGNKCPVFLFFSVNASGQFCGVAEMTGHVDFNKSMDFWQQDKWNGFFPVKWHVIKDVPNPQFRHIILENNENKPVTNSRDTQEVKFPQGTEMLNIFKSYSTKTSILDDFAFYENRQKAMQDKKIKSPITNVGCLTPRTDDIVQVTKLVEVKPAASSLHLMKSVVNDVLPEELPSGGSVEE